MRLSPLPTQLREGASRYERLDFDARPLPVHRLTARPDLPQAKLGRSDKFISCPIVHLTKIRGQKIKTISDRDRGHDHGRGSDHARGHGSGRDRANGHACGHDRENAHDHASDHGNRPRPPVPR